MTLPLSKLRSIRDRLAPEAADQYLLELPAGWPTPRNTAAYSITGRHLLLRDHLQATGEFRGFHSGVVIVPPAPPDAEEYLGLMIHEWGHGLPALCLPDFEPTDQQRQEQEMVLLAWSTADPDPSIQTAPPWLDHDDRFIRRVLHLAYRASLIGLEIPLPCLRIGGAVYGLSGAWKYRRALGDEPKRMVGRTFEEIESEAAPKEFFDVFVADVREWIKTKGNRDDVA